MPGDRFVLRYQGDGSPPPAEVGRVQQLPGVAVVDSAPRMLLVEGPPEHLRQLVDDMPDWSMAPEQTYPVPDTRQRVERPPA